MEGNKKDNKGEEPYSPGASTVSSDDELMDWSNNLQGVRVLMNDEEQYENRHAGGQLVEDPLANRPVSMTSSRRWRLCRLPPAVRNTFHRHQSSCH
jgi:hypothetical protein